LPNALVVTRFLCQLQLQTKRIARAAQGFASSFVFAGLKLVHPRSKVRVAHVGQRLRAACKCGVGVGVDVDVDVRHAVWDVSIGGMTVEASTRTPQ